MSRVAQSFAKSKLIAWIVPLVIFGVGAGIALTNQSPKVQVSTTQSQATDVKYKGVNGQTALALLEKYTRAGVKHYSFGDFVTSVNGAAGNGPKYWSFYVNGKLSDVGAGSYVTKSTDNIEWKLQ